MYSNKSQKKKRQGGKKKVSRTRTPRDTYAIAYGRPTRSYTAGLPRAIGMNYGMVDTICSVLDPFCPAARGAKFPDQAMYPSVSYSIKHIIPVTTLATGNACVEIRAQPNGLFRSATAIDVVTGDVTTFGAFIPVVDIATLTTHFSQYRVVSFGVHIFTSCNVNESKGIVNVMTNDSIDPGTVTNVLSSFYGESEIHPVYGFKGSWIGKTRGPESQVYIQFAQTAEHSVCTIGISGATASTTIMTAEVYMHLELLPIPLSTMAQLTTAAAPFNPQAMAIISNVASTTKFASSEEPVVRHKSILDRVNNALGVFERATAIGERVAQIGNDVRSRTPRIGN